MQKKPKRAGPKLTQVIAERELRLVTKGRLVQLACAGRPGSALAPTFYGGGGFVLSGSF